MRLLQLTVDQYAAVQSR